MAKKKELALTELKYNPKNPRKHGKKNIELIVSALEEIGAGRSIVIDEDGTILAGNGTVEAARKAGITKLRVIDTDGSELVAVRRRNLSEGEKDRLVLYDNHATDTSEDDPDVLKGMDLNGIYDDDFILKLQDSENKEVGEIQFSEELDRESNYVVLKFDRDIDFLQIQTLLGLKSTHSKRQNGKPWSKGIGRVVDGVDAVEAIKGA